MPGRRAAPEAATRSRARPWELRKVLAIDVMDAVGSNIRLDVRQREVLRVLPRINEDVNEEWISDKARHAGRGLIRSRLDRPWVREKGQARAGELGRGLRGDRQAAKQAGASVAAVAGDLLDAETMYAAKALLGAHGLDPDREPPDRAWPMTASNLAAVDFNSTIAGIEDADAILLVGSNPRWEAPLVNIRLRKAAQARREGVRDRPGSGLDLSGSNGSATISRCSASSGGCRLRRCKAAAAGSDRRRRRPGGRARSDRRWRWPRAGTWSATAGTDSTSSTSPRRAWAG